MAEDAQLGPVFTAEYRSQCEGCDEPIFPGEDARSDGDGGWVHADAQCVRTITDTTPYPSCPACFQIKAANGLCGCDS